MKLLLEGGTFKKIKLSQGTKLFIYTGRVEQDGVVYQLKDKTYLYDTSYDVENTCVDMTKKDFQLYKGVRELHYVGELWEKNHGKKNGRLFTLKFVGTTE